MKTRMAVGRCCCGETTVCCTCNPAPAQLVLDLSEINLHECRAPEASCAAMTPDEIVLDFVEKNVSNSNCYYRAVGPTVDYFDGFPPDDFSQYEISWEIEMGPGTGAGDCRITWVLYFTKVSPGIVPPGCPIVLFGSVNFEDWDCTFPVELNITFGTAEGSAGPCAATSCPFVPVDELCYAAELGTAKAYVDLV